jgi:hypothetical protein
LIANAGIDHQVEAMPFRPFQFEILLDESCAIIVNRFHEIDRFLLALAVRLKPADLVLKGSIDKDVKGVAAVRKVVGGASADDHGITGFRDLQQDFMGYFSDAVGIHRVEPGRDFNHEVRFLLLIDNDESGVRESSEEPS